MIYKKRMLYHFSSLLCTSLFLIVSTYYWFFIRDFHYQKIENETILVSNSIEFPSLSRVSDEKIDTLNSYHFTISNQGDTKQSVKIIVVSDLFSDNISNNYVKYRINDSRVQSLNMDGIIYIDDFASEEEKEFDLKLWISDTYLGDLNYNGRVIVG